MFPQTAITLSSCNNCKRILVHHFSRVHSSPSSMKFNPVQISDKINRRGVIRNLELTFKNPLDRLQVDYAGPLLPPEDRLFSPNIQDMEKGQKVFISTPRHQINFVKSVISYDKLPTNTPAEVAIVGRSNAGKSSLLRAMFEMAPEARIGVSKRPGHTTMMNFFQVGKAFTMVDMPGYGVQMPSHYMSSVGTYLQNRDKLVKTILIMDATLGITKDDRDGIDLLESSSVSYVVVLSKVDMSLPSVIGGNFLKVRQELKKCKAERAFPQQFLVSSITGEGLALLQTFIAHITGAFKCVHH